MSLPLPFVHFVTSTICTICSPGAAEYYSDCPEWLANKHFTYYGLLISRITKACVRLIHIGSQGKDRQRCTRVKLVTINKRRANNTSFSEFIYTLAVEDECPKPREEILYLVVEKSVNKGKCL